MPAKLTRRPKGQAAELIMKAVQAAKPDPLSMADLDIFTDLPPATLRDNLVRLCSEGCLRRYKDRNGRLWVQLPE